MKSALHIGPIEADDAGREITVHLSNGSQTWSIDYKASEGILSPDTEAFVALALLPCMKMRLDCATQGSMSPVFDAGIETVQDVFQDWKPKYERVKIRGVHLERKKWNPRGRVGLFFSGGLDSFYSLLKRQDEITDLIFIHGFDVPLEDHALRGVVLEMVQRVAAHFDKRVVEIETNARSFLEGFTFWGLSHGGAMASIGHLLAPEFNRIYMAGSGVYRSLTVWGSHPLLDPFWSSESIDFVCEGFEASRARKAALVAEYDIALQSLRVCLKNLPSGKNCGRCEKCVRTMIDLRISGALDRYPNFEAPLDLGRIYRMYAKQGYLRIYLQKSLQYLEEYGSDPELERALHKLMDRPAVPKRLAKPISKLVNKIRPRGDDQY